jgi:hypothetical protein
MSVFLGAALPGVKGERFRQVQQYFNTPAPQMYVNIGIALLAIVSVYMLMKLLNYLQNRRQEESRARPMALFLRVQSQMGLSLPERWNLWRLAKTLKVANPTALLISPVLFDRAVAEYGARRSGTTRQQLAAIRRRLFGRPRPTTME